MDRYYDVTTFSSKYSNVWRPGVANFGVITKIAILFIKATFTNSIKVKSLF